MKKVKVMMNNDEKFWVRKINRVRKIKER